VGRLLSADASAPSFLRSIALALRLLGTLWHPRSGSRLRSELWTRLRHGKRHFQGSTFTLPERFPVLFARCRVEFGPAAEPRILSFGCSTGEEVFTLARYLPAAHIVGVDINRWCLRQARKANHEFRIGFLHSLSPEFAAATGFDAIFCLAVLQRSENAVMEGRILKSGFLFEDFASTIAMLDEKLRPGGLFFIDQADFSFLDTPTARNYEALDFPANERPRLRPLFDRENRQRETAYRLPRVFRKKIASGSSGGSVL
jgi:SAM-dependent methyltransferase